MKMREEFEAWALSSGREIERYDDGPCEYASLDTDSDWICWQASRAALVIELPEFREDSDAVDAAGVGLIIPQFDQGYDEGVAECRAAIEAAGVKINQPSKPDDPERVCPGCGEQGFTANCMQCIPY
jgi:hypothetical protein